MELVNSLKTFLHNHRKKFFISGLAVGGAVALFSYLRHQEEKRQKYEISNFLENVRRERYCETIHTTCDQTIISLCKKLEKQIISLLDIDRIVTDLKRSPPKNLELWDKLKISAFTQICLLIYSQTLLVFTLRMQFAIIGGYTYSHLHEKNEHINRELQEKYLSLCVDFIRNGLPDLYSYVRLKVSNVVSGLNLEKKLTVQGLQDIFWSIQASVDSNEFIDNMSSYLKIESQIDDGSSPLLCQIFEETTNILESKELTSVCINSLLHCGFTTVTEQLAKKSSTDSMPKQGIPTAKLLPVLHNLIKSGATVNDQSIWSKNLMNCTKLKVLAENVYESFC